MKKPIVVTGAGGFIGRNVVAELNVRGYDNLLLVDSLGQDEKWRNLLGLQYEDILDPDEFLASVENGKVAELDALIHLGACSSTTERDADFLLRNNYRYTQILCEYCLRENTRFIYASSAATYGDGSHGYSDDVAELPVLRPLNMYGYSKHMFDLWARKQKLFDRIVGLKYFNVFGPYEDHKGDMRSMAAKSYEQIRKSGKVELFKSYRPDYADGEQKRDFIYVKDAVAMTLHFLAHRDIGGLFNCGTGQARSWKDLAMAVFAAMKLPQQIEFIEMPAVLQGKYQYFTEAPMEKMRKTGYRMPFRSLEDAVIDYVANYLKKRDDSEAGKHVGNHPAGEVR
ncbi:MAG: ADP-glyceromanno-heptose 6-epimerase [Acidobacteriaceae bacterium]